MLRIGDLAGLTGVTPRTVRHYHRIGLLPEPVRDGSGYRVYGLPDLARLIRVRRLAALGLSLAEAGDALAASGDADLRETLLELDADLARRETEIRHRRETIARLLEHGDAPDLSPELAKALRELSTAAGRSWLSEKEREALHVLEHADPAMSAVLADGYRRIAADPELTARMADLGARFEGLAGVAEFSDADLEPLAAGFAEVLPR